MGKTHIKFIHFQGEIGFSDGWKIVFVSFVFQTINTNKSLKKKRLSHDNLNSIC